MRSRKQGAPEDASRNAGKGSMGATTACATAALRPSSITWKMPTCERSRGVTAVRPSGDTGLASLEAADPLRPHQLHQEKWPHASLL